LKTGFDVADLFIGKVDECFQIKSRGCILSFENVNSAVIKVNDKIKLITPEKEVIDTSVRGIEMINYKHNIQPNYSIVSFLIEYTERSKVGFPKGTEIYLKEEN
jgi:translation elongation factor EF-Tu-like GTPase